MKQKVSVLHVVNKWEQGGVEKFIENIISCNSEPMIEQSILSMCTPISANVDCPQYGPMYTGTSMTSMLRAIEPFGRFLKEHQFDVVHIHTNNSSGFLYAATAKRCGVTERIVHSHSSSLGEGASAIKKIAQKVFRLLYGGEESIRLACSLKAGEHLFGNRDYLVIPNGVNTRRYSFDVDARKEVRHGFGLEDGDKLIGCVGSLVSVKNHKKAIASFARVHAANPSSKLLLLGDGELRPALEEQVADLGLEDSVMMPGFVVDAERYYSALDTLLLPSFFEGFPISLVEAQCCGLPIVASDVVTTEVKITDLITFVGLNDSDEAWARAILRASTHDRNSAARCVEEKGFSIAHTVEVLNELYVA